MAADAAPAATSTRAHRRSLRSRLIVTWLPAFAGVLQRLPDRLLHRLAHRAGGLLYWTQPNRRRLVRDNLAQVCRYAAEKGLVEPDSATAAAARDERALERMVRAAYGHYVRTYLEVATLPTYARADRADRVVADDPALLEAAFGLEAGKRTPVVVVALHFGAMEIPALWGVQRGLRVTAPMETLADRDLQAYLVRSRGASGIDIVPARGAARQLTAALARGEVVAVVADRLVGGSGAPVELFGRTTRLPIGPAVLAIETGADAWLVAARRSGWGTYRGHLERIAVPAEGARRARISGFLETQARAFERAVAQAPEQWWSIFFPIWAAERTTGGATA